MEVGGTMTKKGQKDGAQRGKKDGGRRKNKTDKCRHPKR